MDQVGYEGVDENTFVDLANGWNQGGSPVAGESPGITTDSKAGTSTRGFGKTQREGQAKGGKL
jgi:hypothetical protein